MLDMLTADAAAKHGHEYSAPRSQSPPGNGSFFTQMPLSIIGSVLRRQAASPAPATSATDDEQTSTESSDAAPEHTRPMTAQPSTPASPTHSRPASLSSIASVDGKPKKRVPRPRTTFNLAQPPPITGPRQKLHLRPKILLQLHQVVPGRRPKPVYEVIPFSLLAPRSTRRLARTFNTKDRLGPNDLLIVRAAPYEHRDEEEKTDDERWGTREVIGIICPARKSDKDPNDKTEVLMADGSSWQVSNMPNGGYEFCCTDDHGLTLKRRWVPKGPQIRRVSTMSSASQPLGSPLPTPDDKKFNFSTISPNSRRHPVIGSLSRASIDVLDSYTMPSATSPPTPGLPPSALSTPLPTPASIPDVSSFLDNSLERLSVKTDDSLRTFMVLSGIWVAFSENWSAAYSWAKSIACPPLITSRPVPNRTVSMSFIESPRSTSPASTTEENRRALPKLLRSSTQKLQSSTTTSLTTSTSSPTTTIKTSPSSTPSSPKAKTRSRRSNSTGNAELISKNGSTRKRFGLAFENETLPETEEERQSKRSIELLRIKELALPGTPTVTPTPTDPRPSTPVPVTIIEPPIEVRSPPPSPDLKGRKTQSAYNPVTTAGLWDSGVKPNRKSKSRPTSLVVVKQKEEKAKRKQERKEACKEKGMSVHTDGWRSGGFRQRFLAIFRKEKK